MGRPPEGQRLEEMLYCLTRLQNGSVPSLRAAVAEARGLDLRELQDNPSQMHPVLGELNGALLDEVDGQCHELISKMMAAGFAREKGVEAAIAAFPKNNGRLIEIVSYLCDQVYPNVMATTDEVRNLLHGIEGGYVPPGPSGSPTRGNAHLLPTGRNFYTLDPDSIPSPTSWEIGKKMADQMVERHVKEKGCYPKSVGIVIWAIDTMSPGNREDAFQQSPASMRYRLRRTITSLWERGFNPPCLLRAAVVASITLFPMSSPSLECLPASVRRLLLSRSEIIAIWSVPEPVAMPVEYLLGAINCCRAQVLASVAVIIALAMRMNRGP